MKKQADPNHVYIIAEAGVNHNGQRDLAFALVDAAVAAGADAVKFQTFDAQKLASKSAPKAAYQKLSTDAAESQLVMLKKLELRREWHQELQSYSQKKDIEFLSTAFDTGSLEFLVELGIPIFKIPSGELTNGPLLWQFARTNKPLIISTGMATLSEVELGLAVVAHALNADKEPTSLNEVWLEWSQQSNRQRLTGRVTLLHCTSQYPTPISQVNLQAMSTLASAFGLPVGYSDHTEGSLIAVAAVARGARVIEKHFTLDRSLPGPDHQASLEPDELKRMVSEIRALQAAIGDGVKAPQKSEWDTRIAARQQVITARDISAGSILSREDLTTSRCGQGIPANDLWALVGKQVFRDHSAHEILTID
jgi:N-acetylneuraminate synthase